MSELLCNAWRAYKARMALRTRRFFKLADKLNYVNFCDNSLVVIITSWMHRQMRGLSHNVLSPHLFFMCIFFARICKAQDRISLTCMFCARGLEHIMAELLDFAATARPVRTMSLALSSSVDDFFSLYDTWNEVHDRLNYQINTAVRICSEFYMHMKNTAKQCTMVGFKESAMSLDDAAQQLRPIITELIEMSTTSGYRYKALNVKRNALATYTGADEVLVAYDTTFQLELANRMQREIRRLWQSML